MNFLTAGLYIDIKKIVENTLPHKHSVFAS